MINLQTTTRVLTPEDVYGMTPEELMMKLVGRQEYVDFAVPTGPVQFLASDGTVKTHNPNKGYKFGGPRLIVSERRLRRIVYTETGEVRAATTGTPWLSTDGEVMTHATDVPVPILVREVQEVQ